MHGAAAGAEVGLSGWNGAGLPQRMRVANVCSLLVETCMCAGWCLLTEDVMGGCWSNGAAMEWSSSGLAPTSGRLRSGKRRGRGAEPLTGRSRRWRACMHAYLASHAGLRACPPKSFFGGGVARRAAWATRDGALCLGEQSQRGRTLGIRGAGQCSVVMLMGQEKRQRGVAAKSGRIHWAIDNTSVRTEDRAFITRQADRWA